MLHYQLSTFKGGWYMGDFEPSLFRTSQFEVGLKRHRKGEDWPSHFQRQATEYNLLLHGRMTLNGVTINKGDLVVVEPREIVKPVFRTHCEVVVVKVPSMPGDKVLA